MGAMAQPPGRADHPSGPRRISRRRLLGTGGAVIGLGALGLSGWDLAPLGRQPGDHHARPAGEGPVQVDAPPPPPPVEPTATPSELTPHATVHWQADGHGLVRTSTGSPQWSDPVPVQEAVQQAGPNATILLTHGVYRGFSVVPLPRQTFLGEPGGDVRLRGTRLLDAIPTTAGLLVRGLHLTPRTLGFVYPGRERDLYPNDLFVDGERLRHVGPGGTPQAGTWTFDYAQGEVRIDPGAAGHEIELSVLESAFHDGGAAIPFSVRNVTIERYACPAQVGAVQADRSAVELTYVAVVDNHGTGVKVGAGSVVRHALIARNGQLGFAGNCEHDHDGTVVLEDSEIAHNLQLGYQWEWEGGAMKIVFARSPRVRNCWVHDNAGPGVWFDIDNIDPLTTSCLIERNAENGVFYEIGFGGRIVDNVIRDNGRQAVGDNGAGITIANTAGVVYERNVLHGNRFPLLFRHGDRGRSWRSDEHAGRAWEGRDLHGRHNDILAEGAGASGLRLEVPSAREVLEGSRSEANTWRTRDPAQHHWFWDGPLDWDGWQRRGFDTTSTVSSELDPDYAVVRAPFRRAVYGPI